MTREEFLARAALLYDAGLVTAERLRLLERWTDTMLRQGHCEVKSDPHQWEYVRDAMADEKTRLTAHLSAEGRPLTLASDADGYALVQIAAVLNHPCQICACSPDAYWTKPGFCPHRKETP